MGKYIIEGQYKIIGECDVQGAKNSALPILAATVLVKGVSLIHNCPNLSDIDATINILKYLGCKVKREGQSISVDSTNIDRYDIPDKLMHEMRSSIIFLGAILGRLGKADLSLPGGCEIGLRPIDLHLDAMKRFGAKINEEHGRLECVCEKPLEGTEIVLSFPSVGATENIMLVASTAKGRTKITNAAREPEISDLADFLNCCGAKIQGAGEGVIIIDGVPSLKACEHRVIPDRIVVATYMAAAAMTGGEIFLNNVIPAHVGPVIPVFEEAGCNVSIEGSSIHLTAPPRLKAVSSIRTMPYPGFPTDIQAPIMAMTSIAKGTSIIVETIFESRFKHVNELVRMGAKIRVDGRVAVIEGVPYLTGAKVTSSDLRGGSALVLAGLAAKGTTELDAINHIDRGYEDFEKQLSALGAKIKRIEGKDESQREDNKVTI